ncbi:hypothetical protein [Lysobacter fragariae]
MGFFSRKPKVRLAEFCRNFYDTHHFPSAVGGVNPTEGYAQVIQRSIVEVQPTFAAVNPASLASEIAPLRFEIFGLAWLHRLGDKRAAEQSDFTMRYLNEVGRADVWQAIKDYNGASARSSTLGRNSDSAAGRAYLTLINTTRANLFDEWTARGFDPDAVARAANRIGTETAWKTGLTSGFLMLALCQRLNCEPNEAAQDRIAAVVRGFYNGAVESLKVVTIND